MAVLKFVAAGQFSNRSLNQFIIDRAGSLIDVWAIAPYCMHRGTMITKTTTQWIEGGIAGAITDGFDVSFSTHVQPELTEEKNRANGEGMTLAAYECGIGWNSTIYTNETAAQRAALDDFIKLVNDSEQMGIAHARVGGAGGGLTLSITGNTNPGLVTPSINGSLVTLAYTASTTGTADITVRSTNTDTSAFIEDTFTATVNAVPTETNLVAHWKFDESGSTIMDSSGNGNDATLVGASRVTGYFPTGTALSFDGVDDYVDLENLDIGTSGITLACWFKADTWIGASRDDRLISKSTGTATNDHYWMLSPILSGANTRLRARLKTSGTTLTLIATSGNIQLDTWYHAALTYDGSDMRLYLDGVEVGTVAKTGAVDTNAAVNAWIGRNPDGQLPFDGTIDDVRIYDAGLSEAQVQALVSNADLPVVDQGFSHVSVSEDSDDFVISLADTFADRTDSVAEMSYAVQANSNAGLVTPSILGTTLTLAFTAATSGTANITIRATDTDANTVDASFRVVVNASGADPSVNIPITDIEVFEDAADSVRNLSATFSGGSGGTEGLIQEYETKIGGPINWYLDLQDRGPFGHQRFEGQALLPRTRAVLEACGEDVSSLSSISTSSASSPSSTSSISASSTSSSSPSSISTSSASSPSSTSSSSPSSLSTSSSSPSSPSSTSSPSSQSTSSISTSSTSSPSSPSSTSSPSSPSSPSSQSTSSSSISTSTSSLSTSSTSSSSISTSSISTSSTSSQSTSSSSPSSSSVRKAVRYERFEVKSGSIYDVSDLFIPPGVRSVVVQVEKAGGVVNRDIRYTMDNITEPRRGTNLGYGMRLSSDHGKKEFTIENFRRIKFVRGSPIAAAPNISLWYRT